jgi:hypothetical protein
MPKSATARSCCSVISGLGGPLSQLLSAPTFPATMNTVAVNPNRTSVGTARVAKSA